MKGRLLLVNDDETDVENSSKTDHKAPRSEVFPQAHFFYCHFQKWILATPHGSAVCL